MGVYFSYYIFIAMLSAFLMTYTLRFSSNSVFSMDKKRRERRQAVLLVVVATVLLALIIGFRSEYNGLDLHNSAGTGYFYYYEKINEDSVWEILGNFGKRQYANFEIGFCLFCKLIGTLCKNQQILLLASALVAVVPVGYFIRKNSENVWLSFMLYISMPFFGPANFSAIRQGMAIGLVVLSLEFVKRKKLLLFLLIVLIASSIHSTAIVACVAYPAYHFRVTKKSALYGGVGALFVLFLLREPVFQLLARLLDEDAEIVKSSAINLFLLLTFAYTMCAAFGRNHDERVRGFTNICWLACAAQIFAGINNLAGRVTWYFMTPFIILLPNVIANMNIKERGLRKCMPLIIGILACIVGLYFLRNDMVAVAYPYEPFWA